MLIKLKLVVTHDFIMEILSHGDNVKVIKPENLISEVKAVLKNALSQY
ncbi:MAG: hypothetical protein ACOYN4_09395 [Bacteroidales bacterium]